MITDLLFLKKVKVKMTLTPTTKKAPVRPFTVATRLRLDSFSFSYSFSCRLHIIYTSSVVHIRYFLSETAHLHMLILLYIIWFFFIQTCQLLVLLFSHPNRLPLLLSPLHIFSSHKPSPCLRHHTDLNNQLQLLKQTCEEEMHHRGISFEQIATWLMQIMDHRSMSQIIFCDHNFFG